ncbi:MAG TPA: GIY-YIG nuclease family protein [Rhizomicrobium sp.]|jgi:predicted GIY-YIG superfamily endonuclease|nr:GIY-YIG nuclease family protein [Rhizomicrobium sp.]
MGIYVYVLRCADKSCYVGLTRAGLDKRIGEHKYGKYPKCYAFKRRPVELVWSQDFRSLKDAIACSAESKAGVAQKKKHSSPATLRLSADWRGRRLTLRGSKSSP